MINNAMTPVPIISNEILKNQMVDRRLTRTVGVYRGTMEDNLKAAEALTHNSQTVTVTQKAWKGTEKRENVLRTIYNLRQKIEEQKNANQGVDPNLVSQLMGAYFIDMIRLSDEQPDYTGVLATEIVRPDMPKDVNLRDFLPYTGKEAEVAGSNDAIPLIEENIARITPATLAILAFGHKNSIYDVVFNPFYDIQRVMETAATIRIDSRNDDVIGKIVRSSFDTNHSVPADTTGANHDLKIYNTVKAGLKKLNGLYHPHFINRKIGGFNKQVYLLVNPVDADTVQPVVSGALANLGGINQLVGRLPLSGIIPYGCGIQDGLPWGKEILSYPGVQEGVFYLVATTMYGGFVFTKRDLTLETGVGDVLQLSTEARAWYRIRAVMMDWLLGGVKEGKNTGCIIKGELPQ